MPGKDDSPPPLYTSTAREFFVARDRAKRFVFRLKQVATERGAAWAGDRIGMTSFAEAGPALVAIEDDVAATIAGVVEGRFRDRERGETEIPLAVALESVLERVRRAHRVADLRSGHKAPAEWAERRFAALLTDAVRRIEAFCAVYDEKRPTALPALVDLGHLLGRVEADASLDRVGAVVATPPEPSGTVTTLPPPRLMTVSDALDDLLRAVRAEVTAAAPPWRVTGSSATAPLVLAIGAEGATAPASEPVLGLDPARARTHRAAAVLRFAHGVEVLRVEAADGAAAGIVLRIEDRLAGAVAKRLSGDARLAPAADAAVRSYLVATEKGPSAGPEGLVAAMGLFRAVEAELERVLSPALQESAPRVVAARVPREASRKAPVKREVVAALAAAFPDFPVHRVNDVLDAVAHGKATAAHVKPPDAAVVLAVFGRRWPGGGGFGERALPLGSLSDDDVLASVRDVISLHGIRQALERAREPGADWPQRFESAAFGLLACLSRRGAGESPAVG